VTTIAASERTLLSASAERVGPDAPTLCAGWTVRDLVAHLLVREGSPAAVGVAVKPLSGWLESAMEKRRGEDFGSLVARLQEGPPAYSPFALPWLGPKLNLLEFYVHHEDILRAQPQWEPRSLSRATEDGIWRSLRLPGRGLVARAGLAVSAVRTDTGVREVLCKGTGEVVVRGLPSEVTLYLFGRKAQARVELDGAPEDVAVLEGTPLGI
jgi:uncharacterized protein (TIGR03085 family)